MKITYARGLDASATLAKIEGIHTPSLADIESRIVKAVEKRLFHLPKKYRAGASLVYVSAGVDTKAYRFPVNGVKVRAVLTATAIRIETIAREACFPKSRERVNIRLTEEQADILANNAVSYAQAAA